MREAIGKTVPLRRPDDRHLLTHLVNQCFNPAARFRIKIRIITRLILQVEAEIKDRKLQLAHHLHCRVKILRRNHTLVEIIRYRLGCLIVRRDHIERLPFPAPVLQKLARQLHRIPGNAVDAGNPGVVDFCQHVVQTMTKFVEQRLHLFMRKQRRLVTHRRREVTGEIGDRCVTDRFTLETHHTLIHPGATTFVPACIEIEIELAAQYSAGILDLEETHIGMPAVDALFFCDMDVKQTSHHFKQAGDHPIFRKIGLQLLLGNVIALLPQFFCIVGNIPRFQLFNSILCLGELPQLRILLLRLQA